MEHIPRRTGRSVRETQSSAHRIIEIYLFSCILNAAFTLLFDTQMHGSSWFIDPFLFICEFNVYVSVCAITTADVSYSVTGLGLRRYFFIGPLTIAFGTGP